MGISVKLQHEANISELIRNRKEFDFLKDHNIPDSHMFKWEYCGKPSKIMHVIVIGKSGYGKSTTLNRLIGKEVFETSAVEACTKELYSADYKLKSYNQYFSLCDLPGIGESLLKDKEYRYWYSEMLQKATTIVYVLRADQRDFTVDLNVYNELIKDHSCREHTLFAINCADKIEPINRSEQLSEEQKANLKKKINEVKRVFSTDNVVAYSAETGYNFDVLSRTIAQMVKEHRYHIFYY